MRPDIYTKTVLTVIAAMLAVIACRPLISPETTVSAQGPFAGVLFSGVGGSYSFFDTRTGDLWTYSYEMPKARTYVGKVTKLGQPLADGGK